MSPYSGVPTAPGERPSLGQWLYRQMRQRAWTRRAVLGSLGGLTLIGCSGGEGSSSNGAASTGTTGAATSGTTTGTVTAGTTAAASSTCVLIPEETVGPFPLFNDIASAAVYQREDIAEGRPGLPLRLTLSIVNVNQACAPVTTAMVYVWHCDKDGLYSGYNQAGGDLRGRTFCRGVQTTDTNGQVRFTTIYPGWYQGRATHIHFRVYLALDLQATSQLAFQDNVNAAVYATSQYAAKGQNPTLTLRDGIFADGVTYQLPTIRENTTLGGYDAALTVGIAI